LPPTELILSRLKRLVLPNAAMEYVEVLNSSKRTHSNAGNMLHNIACSIQHIQHSFQSLYISTDALHAA